VLAIAATVFAVIFLAELPDKSALASLVLASRYQPLPVLAGVAGAFGVHVVLAVAAGSLLDLLPHRAVDAVSAGLFALGAVLLLLGYGQHGGQVQTDARPANAWRVAVLSFTVIFVAEFGDLTQIIIASLAARYNEPFLVGIAAALGLWAVAVLAVAGGRGLLRILPLKWITRAAALVMLVLAAFSLVAALR
jgi:putative Ca2+/H+ antiporter (TMEM165/GDT1 family)